MNIDLKNSSTTAYKYEAILRLFNLNQHIKDPTRKGKWLIDHFITNIPHNVVATSVLPTPEVSDHDMPYVIVNARLSRFEKITILNELLRSCIDRHAPLVRCKITRPPAPWLQDVNIRHLQKERDHSRFTAQQTQAESDWSLFRSVRNKVKTAIKTAKRTFYSKALSSKHSKVVWMIIH
jgi:hypothetical protein